MALGFKGVPSTRWLSISQQVLHAALWHWPQGFKEHVLHSTAVSHVALYSAPEA